MTEPLKVGIHSLTQAIAGPMPGRVGWDEPWATNTQRWDLASTGGAGNITPIVGFLWLSARSRASACEETRILCPKVSTKGNSCGTVDILEAGGLEFLENRETIMSVIKEQGSVLCRQSHALTPNDTLLMDVRRDCNAMKNIALTYASILGKKIQMGCTHAVVDVKIGKDTKMLAEWMSDAQIDFVTAMAAPDDLVANDLSTWQGILVALGVADQFTGNGSSSLLNQTCSDLDPLISITWLCTNSDIPQGRAIGRQLILHQFNEWLGEGRPSFWPKQHEHLYEKLVRDACGAGTFDLQVLRDEWSILATQLPFMSQPGLMARADLRTLLGPEGDRAKLSDDLEMVAVRHGDDRSGVHRIDASALDRLFDWLCDDNKYDPEVGIWLHVLPGESVKKAGKILSVFYRPTPTRSGDDVLHRARALVREAYRFS